MGKSFFILNSERKGVMSAQFRRMRDELRDCSLGTEGVFADKSGSVEAISEAVRLRMERGGFAHPIGAAIATLAPQNLPVSEPSWLKVPFLLSGASGPCDSAGSVACADASNAESGSFRKADLEALSLLGVAVLRRLGIPAYFAYRHFDPSSRQLRVMGAMAGILGIRTEASPMPCLLVAEGRKVGIYSFMPPYVDDPALSRMMAGLEILDDSALLGLMRIKSAYLHTLALLSDYAKNVDYIQGEGEMVAAGIGHVLHEGLSSWSVEEAQNGLEDAKRLLNPKGKLPLTSMRLIVENNAVHTLICPVHHFIMAAEVILCANAKKDLKGLFQEALADQSFSLQDLMENATGILSGHGCVNGLMEYLNLAMEMNLHVHSMDECPRRLEQN